MQNTELITLVAELMEKVEAKDKEIAVLKEKDFWQAGQILGMEHDSFELSEEQLKQIDELSMRLAFNKSVIECLQKENERIRAVSQSRLADCKRMSDEIARLELSVQLNKKVVEVLEEQRPCSTHSKWSVKISDDNDGTFGTIKGFGLSDYSIANAVSDGFISTETAVTESLGMTKEQYATMFSSCWDCGKYDTTGYSSVEFGIQDSAACLKVMK